MKNVRDETKCSSTEFTDFNTIIFLQRLEGA